MLPVGVTTILIRRTAIEYNFVGRPIDRCGMAIDHFHHFACFVQRLGQAQMYNRRWFDQAIAFVMIEILIGYIVIVMRMLLRVVIDFGRCAAGFCAINADALV